MDILVDKKVASPGSLSQEKDRQHAVDKACALKNRRRDIYGKLSSDKKEALLLQRRTRYEESYNQNHCTNCTPLPNAQLRRTGQRGITITELSAHIETGSTICADTSMSVLGKGKKNVGCFSIFEHGSTSTIPAQQANPKTAIIPTKGSVSLTHQWYDPKAMADKNRGLAI